MLSGGAANVDYGKSKIIKPITVYLFGKATTKGLKGEKIDIQRIFKDSVNTIFRKVFLTQKEILKFIKYEIDINEGVGKEYPKSYYLPRSLHGFIKIKSNRTSNDTVMVVGSFPHTQTEILAIDIENYINSSLFKKEFPETGFDVKVLIAKINKRFDITICIPFIAKRTPSFFYYSVKKELIQKKLIKYIKRKGINNFLLKINTKDRGKFGYLTVFGTALDKGDFGTVGRGNKYSGTIPLVGPSNIEAPCGKNPTHHAGKIYTILAYDIAYDIFNYTRNKSQVFITTRNGDPIEKPANIIIEIFSDNQIGEKKEIVQKIINKRLNLIKTGRYTKAIINSDVLQNFKNRKIPLISI